MWTYNVAASLTMHRKHTYDKEVGSNIVQVSKTNTCFFCDNLIVVRL